MSAYSPTIHSPFYVMYAGVIPSVDFSPLDPSGRSDLLKTIDNAMFEGTITFPRRLGQFNETGKVELDTRTLTISGLTDKHVDLRVPIHQIASVGYVCEQIETHFVHIVSIKIGEVHRNASVFDLSIMYCRTKELAETLCENVSLCFQKLYRETVLSVPQAVLSRSRTATTTSSPLYEDLRSGSTQPRAPSSDSGLVTAHPNELANEYVNELSNALSGDELQEFAELLARWQAEELPIKEFTLKLLELYGPKRKRLLNKLGHLMGEADAGELRSFLRINGVETD